MSGKGAVRKTERGRDRDRDGQRGNREEEKEETRTGEMSVERKGWSVGE